MFRKLLAFSMITIILIVNANASSGSGLKEAFDELNYSLSVEWDQKDKVFYDQEMENFVTRIKELKAQGLTGQDVVQFIKNNYQDPQLARELEAALNEVELGEVAPAQALSFLYTQLKQNESTGAAWSGWVSDHSLELILSFFLLAGVACIAAGQAKCDFQIK